MRLLLAQRNNSLCLDGQSFEIRLFQKLSPNSRRRIRGKSFQCRLWPITNGPKR